MRFFRTGLTAALIALASGCSTLNNDIPELSQISERRPMRTVTSLSSALACMGQAIRQQQRTSALVRVGQVADMTVNGINLESPLSSAGSAFVQSALTTQLDVPPQLAVVKAFNPALVQTANRVGSGIYTIVGGYSEVDELYGKGLGGAVEVSAGDVEGRVDADRNAAVQRIALDLYLHDVRQGDRIVQGFSGRIEAHNRNNTFQISIGGGGGVGLSIGDQIADGVHAQQRVLAELGTLYLLGHIYRIDPQRCLGQPPAYSEPVKPRQPDTSSAGTRAYQPQQRTAHHHAPVPVSTPVGVSHGFPQPTSRQPRVRRPPGMIRPSTYCHGPTRSVVSFCGG